MGGVVLHFSSLFYNKKKSKAKQMYALFIAGVKSWLHLRRVNTSMRPTSFNGDRFRSLPNFFISQYLLVVGG